VATALTGSSKENKAALVTELIDTRVFTELDALGTNSAVSAIRQDVAKSVLQTLALDGSARLLHWSASLLAHWYHDSKQWRQSTEEALKALVSTLYYAPNWLSLIGNRLFPPTGHKL
jgi:hypothetical protein